MRNSYLFLVSYSDIFSIVGLVVTNIPFTNIIKYWRFQIKCLQNKQPLYTAIKHKVCIFDLHP